MIAADLLTELDTIRHGFFTRQGGVSQGIYASLNCGYGSGDDQAAITENRDRVARRLGRSGANDHQQAPGRVAQSVGRCEHAAMHGEVGRARRCAVAARTVRGPSRPLVGGDLHAAL